MCYFFLTIETEHTIGACNIFEKKMFVAKNFSHSLIEKYEKHTVYTDDVTRYPQS
ncbi:MAG: hypothetical protein ACM3XP_01335 [Nitrososphaerales archaeon]